MSHVTVGIISQCVCVCVLKIGNDVYEGGTRLIIISGQQWHNENTEKLLYCELRARVVFLNMDTMP